ncbi:MAG: nicotinate-nucleotide--dimethylbenzimidazole phosphoribosyltransferase [Oligoflexia bacterium]|nr:nicotinate-nucleotide--dimethylbenzimidazole phosphoribosyltransferase [Oligoflexia bacterium]
MNEQKFFNFSNINIPPICNKILEDLKHEVDSKTKPPGSLGDLESLAIKIGKIQQTLNPQLRNPHILIFAGDHGIAKNSPISPYPQEVTFQMVLNFLSEGAAINVFAKQNNISLKVVDAGVNFDFNNTPLIQKKLPSSIEFLDRKIRMGTRDYSKESAMTLEEMNKALSEAASIVDEIHAENNKTNGSTNGSDHGSNVIGFGEMGIGNTSSASIFLSLLANLPLESCVGAGTGHSSEGIKTKISILENAIKTHAHALSSSTSSATEFATTVMTTFGGYELCMMAGAMLRAAELQMLILVDGFISSSAMLWCSHFAPNILDYTVFSHLSEERAHRLMLEQMDAHPIVNLKMRLGEGTGVAVTYPIIQSAVNFLNQMATFSSAGVANK